MACFHIAGVTCHECDNLARYPAPMPPIVLHSCPDCLALAKVLRQTLESMYASVPTDRRGAGIAYGVGLLDAFIKEREK